MLMTPGRGLSPVPPAAARRTFDLTAALPAELTYARGDGAATRRDLSGKLVRASIDAPRFDHDAGGLALGLLIEGSRQNKCRNYNAAPTNLTNLTATGDPNVIVSIVSDASALAAAGLDQIGNGNVIKIDNSAGSANGGVRIAGQAGNTNAHSMSCHARAASGSGFLGTSGGAGSGGVFNEIAYKRIFVQNFTPAAATDEMVVFASAGSVCYVLLNQFEEGPFSSSEIVTEGAAATRAAESLRFLSPNASYAFDEKRGYMAARYRPYAVATGADQFLVAAHSGSAVDTIGLRLHKTDTDLQGWVRDESILINSLSNDVPHVAGNLQSAAICWKPGRSSFFQGGASRTATHATNPSGLTEIGIGHRNATLDLLWGHVPRVEIGTEALSGALLGNRMYRPGDILAAGGGQSLMGGHFVSQQSGGAQGRAKFIETIVATRKGNVCVFVNGATGSTAASRTSNPVNYWWDLAASARGPAFDTFYARVAESGILPGAIFWAQGEEDSHQIGLATTRAQYKDALNAIFADMRTMFGNVPILIQRIGRRTSFANTGGVQAVREVQQELIDEHAWCHDAAEVYDQSLFDDVHLSDTGYAEVSRRNARKLLSLFGESVSGADGPRIVSVSRSGTSVTVTIAHDGASDFTPSSGIAGFRFFSDAAEISITAAARTNATTITLTLASAPMGSVKTLYYGYDAMLGLNTANVVRDNAAAPMPLRTFKGTVN